MGSAESVPNLFRQVTEDQVCFDPTHVRLEKRLSLGTLVGTAVAVIACLATFADQTFVSTAELTAPSLAAYEQALAVPGLLGHPSCSCSQEVLAHGAAEGGFVDNVTFVLDDLCGVPGEGPVSDLPYSTMFNSMDRAASPGQPAIPPRHGCKGVIGVEHGWSFSYTPWAECAIVQAIMDQIMKEVEILCENAQSVHARAIDNFLKSFMVTEHLLPKTTLGKTVDSKLDNLALQNGVLLYAAAHTGRPATQSAAMLLDKANMSLAMLQNRLAADTKFSRECEDFRAGSDSGVSLRKVLEECAESGKWTGTCCKLNDDGSRSAQCLDPSSYSLPCGSHMVMLSHRLRASEFDTMHSAVYAGIVSGMSTSARSLRLDDRYGIRPPPPDPGLILPGQGLPASFLNGSANASGPARRLLEADDGFALQDDQDQMFARYFESCQARTCSYQYAQPAFKGMLLLLTAFAGGFAVLFRSCGLGGVSAMRYFVNSQNSEVALVEEAPPTAIQVRVSPQAQKAAPEKWAQPPALAASPHGSKVSQVPPLNKLAVAQQKGAPPKVRRPMPV
jgi:hypothetical protein